MREIWKSKFILITLLTAIIIVLVVILVTTKMSTSNSVKNDDKRSFRDNVITLIETVNQRRLTDDNFDPTIIDSGNIKNILNISSNNYSDISIVKRGSSSYINIVGSGEWAGLVACGTYDDLKIVDSQSGECDEDIIPPVITILGDNPINISAGEKYSDAGSSVIDETDGDLTSQIIINNNVNQKIPGIYNVTYSVTDKSGNSSNSIRTVNVIDKSSPIISFKTNGNITYERTYNTVVNVGDTYGDVDSSGLKYLWSTSIITPNKTEFKTSFTNGQIINTPIDVTGSYYLWILAKDNFNNTTIARSNAFNLDNIKPVIILNGNDNIDVDCGSEYSDAGATATDNIDEVISVTTSGLVNSNVVGIYKINYNASDSSGNIATTLTRTVTVVDASSPTVVFGTNGNSTYTKKGNTSVTVSDTYGVVNESTLKYLWSTSTTQPSEASFIATFTNRETISTPTNATGSYYLWILAKDNYDNTTITRSNVFNLDNIKPVITINGSVNVTINAGITYTDVGATATDNIDGTVNVTTSGSVNSNVVGIYKINYNASDSSGNIATTLTRTVTVADASSPTVVFGTNGNSTYAKSHSTTVTVSDNYSLNTSSLKYQWTTSTVVPTEASFSTAFTNGETISTPANVTGSYYLWVLAKDNYDNTTIARSNVFNLDNIKPVITLIGDDNIDIDCGSEYSDAGSTATDNIDGIISVTSTGNINPNVVGLYTITYNATDSSGNTAVQITRTINVVDSTYDELKEVNKPNLAVGMTPIKWDESSWVDTTVSDIDWYNYDTVDKVWANARSADGSMWVWIPRYIYKISSGWHSNIAGSLDIQFSKGIDDNWNNSVIGNIDTDQTSNASNNKWTNHPAFTFGNIELTGIWVAKFEATAVEGVANGYTADSSCPVVGDDVTTKTIKILPNVASWRCISPGNVFTLSRNMEANSVYGWTTASGLQANGTFTTDSNGIDTHLMKSTEWGIVSYLAKSSYGKNTEEIYINNNKNYITGCAGNTASAVGYDGCQNTYESTGGVKASTTGNIYGIYDLSGSAWERVSAYVNNGNSNLNGSGSSIISADSKYKNMYTVGATDDQFSNYALAINFKGDAVYETSSTYIGNTSWFNDLSNMPVFSSMWFIRGGFWSDGSTAGIFNFRYTHGASYSHTGFRPVLLVNLEL